MLRHICVSSTPTKPNCRLYCIYAERTFVKSRHNMNISLNKALFPLSITMSCDCLLKCLKKIQRLALTLVSVTVLMKASEAVYSKRKHRRRVNSSLQGVCQRLVLLKYTLKTWRVLASSPEADIVSSPSYKTTIVRSIPCLSFKTQNF